LQPTLWEILLLIKVIDIMGVFVLTRKIGRFPPILHVNRSATWAQVAPKAFWKLIIIKSL
jgi:hypothetical protein